MFKPLDPISRQDMMVILVRALELSMEYPNVIQSVASMINCEIVKERQEGLR